MIRDLRDWREAWKFYKQSWRLVKKNVNFRYWLLWMVNLFVAMNIASRFGSSDGFSFTSIAAVIIYFAISPLSLILWFPQYLKQKKPEKYTGVIRVIGEWVGQPYRFSNNKHKE